jgi:hypothetical protein
MFLDVSGSAPQTTETFRHILNKKLQNDIAELQTRERLSNTALCVKAKVACASHRLGISPESVEANLSIPAVSWKLDFASQNVATDFHLIVVLPVGER